VEKPNEKLEKTKNWKTRKNMWKNQMKSGKKRKTGKQGKTCGKTNEKLKIKKSQVSLQIVPVCRNQLGILLWQSS